MKRILWFRRDLRVKDNPLLALGGEVLPIFIFDKNILSKLKKNDKRLSYIFFYLSNLKKDLQEIGLDLKVFFAKPVDVFEKLLKDGFDEVVASGDYDAYAKQRDLEISHKIHFRYIQDTYIFKHKEVLKNDGSPYLVFTPFYKKARQLLFGIDLCFKPLAKHCLFSYDYDTLTQIHEDKTSTEVLLDLKSIGFELQDLKIISVEQKLARFKNKINSYKTHRDFLNEEVCSNLSVELRFGTIGIRELLRFMFEQKDSDVEPFIRQLIFRDFYAYLLFYFPNIEDENFKYTFNGVQDKTRFKIFCEAKTGVPIIDAGVRELIQTGSMHNRVRMVVASFFTKDLLLPWQWGEAFFAEYLLDYDKASNVLSWQWSAGTGVDPQPYFRVFNPYLQSKKFDKNGEYIKRYLPQLKDIDAKHLHDENYLLQHTIENYPKPMLLHKEAAKKAIELFKA